MLKFLSYLIILFKIALINTCTFFSFCEINSTQILAMAETKKKPDNSLVDILINVILPVLILSKMSKDGDSFYHLGPVTAMAIALILPLGFGIWHFIKKGKLNLFSCVGLIAILLTGLITIYLYNDTNSRQHVGVIFGIKEAIQPLILGSLFLITHKKATPLLRTFLYNDALFDIPRIEKTVKEKQSKPAYELLLWKCTWIMFGSFCLSAVANFFVSVYFFQDLVPDADSWTVLYNEIVGSITFWGFIIIGVPFFGVMIVIMISLLKGLRKITGLENDNILIPR